MKTLAVAMSPVSSWALLIIMFVIVIAAVTLITRIENRMYQRRANEKMSEEYLWEAKNGKLR